MDILFRRQQKQKTFGAGVNFELRAKIELDEEEKALVKLYKTDRAALIDVEQPGLLRNSIILGLLSLIVVIPTVWWNFVYDIGMGWVGVIAVSAGISTVIGIVVYQWLRESIYVKDLLNGRFFTCRSVCALARKEAHLENISAYLRQVIEAAKHWDGDERRNIQPLPKDQAKQMILSGPLF